MSRAGGRQYLYVRYGVESHKIDANVLLVSLLHQLKIIQEVNKELGEEYHLKLNIEAFKENSFDVSLEVLGILPTIASTFGIGDVADYLSKVIRVFGDLLNIQKHLNGEEPKAITTENNGMINIENNHGNVIVVHPEAFKLYKENLTVNESMREAFEVVQEADDIEFFEIRHKGEGIFRASKQEISNMTADNPLLGKTRQTNLKDEFDVELIVIKPILDYNKNRKWEFLYNGFKISALIKDEKFFEDLVAGRFRFGFGDRLIADMQIEQRYNEALRVWENTGKYYIVRVKGMKPRPDNRELFN